MISGQQSGFWVVNDKGSSWLPTRKAAMGEQRDHGGKIYTEDQYSRLVARLIERQENADQNEA